MVPHVGVAAANSFFLIGYTVAGANGGQLDHARRCIPNDVHRAHNLPGFQTVFDDRHRHRSGFSLTIVGLVASICQAEA
jgi:hypothetical protein